MVTWLCCFWACGGTSCVVEYKDSIHGDEEGRAERRGRGGRKDGVG